MSRCRLLTGRLARAEPSLLFPLLRVRLMMQDWQRSALEGVLSEFLVLERVKGLLFLLPSSRLSCEAYRVKKCYPANGFYSALSLLPRCRPPWKSESFRAVVSCTFKASFSSSSKVSRRGRSAHDSEK